MKAIGEALAAGMQIQADPLDEVIGKMLEKSHAPGPAEFKAAVREVAQVGPSSGAPPAPMAKSMNGYVQSEMPASAPVGHQMLSASAQASENQRAEREPLTGMGQPETTGMDQMWSEDDVAIMQQLTGGSPAQKPLARMDAGGTPDVKTSASADMGGPKGQVSGGASEFEKPEHMGKGIEVQYHQSNNMLFSNLEDQLIAKAQGKDGFISEEVTLGVPGSLLMKSRGCPSCGTHHQAMYTRCPACGHDHSGISKASKPGPGGVQLSKSVARTIRQPVSGDLYLPDGIVIE